MQKTRYQHLKDHKSQVRPSQMHRPSVTALNGVEHAMEKMGKEILETPTDEIGT